MHALMQRAVHDRAHNDQKCHFPPAPFSLKGADGLQPAGTYVVETEEEAFQLYRSSPIAAYPQR